MTVSLTRHGAFAVVSVDHPPVNALSQAVRQGLWDMVGNLDAQEDVTAVILICAGRTFIAGADVSEFGKPGMEPVLRDLVRRIEAARKPWIAAIHGSALGGGFEIALGCRYRVALASASVGLPEVNLGLVPGAGGTVRTPRFAGIGAAVELVTTGRPVRASKAKQMGLIDAVIEGDLLEGSLAFAKACDFAHLPALAQDRVVDAGEPEFWTAAEAALLKRVRGEVAPLRALACVKAASERSFDEALAFERDTFMDLRGSRQASAMRHVFFCERAAPRPVELNGVAPRPVRTVAVIGGGLMGAGITAACRDAGLPVVMIDKLGGVGGGTDIADPDREALAGADLVIEAGTGDLNGKRTVFAELASHCRPDAILATHTSTVDPQLVCDGVPHPERCLGLHFSSPAQVRMLLEIVPADKTDPAVLAAGFALARSVNLIPVRVGFCDGLIADRLLKVLHAQAGRVVQAGASPAQMDAAMRGFGLPMDIFNNRDRDQGQTSLPQQAWTVRQIVDALVLPMVNEGVLVLSAGIARRASDIDLAAIHGFGFPRWLGGPMHWAQAEGLPDVVARLDGLARQGLAEPASDVLRDHSQTGQAL